MSDHGCWKSEYDWEVLGSSSNSAPRKTVLSVLFDDGTQRRFSSVRITLLHSDNVAPKHYEAWQITPLPCSISVVNHVSTQSQNNLPVTHNDPSLPACNVVFMAGRHSTRLQTISERDQVYGELLLIEAISPRSSANTVFEFYHPLTEDTQSVSFSFTSSRLLCTMMSHGIFSDSSSDHSVKVGRVVRVLPVVPINEHRNITLPVDVLLFVFENFRSPPTYRHWRKDILSCALVCREWTCALNLLLIDFRSEDSQQGYPPEIASFADALVARPSLGLAIKHLSARYFEKHPARDYGHLGCYTTREKGATSQVFFADWSSFWLQPIDKPFLSILRVAKNAQTLHLHRNLLVLRDDLADALRGLRNLQAFKGRCPLTMAQFISCITAWPSLTHLSIIDIAPPSGCLPLASLSCCLAEIELKDIPIKDDELTCLVSASGATLERLTLDDVSQLTNAGLHRALKIVCTSLIYLYIVSNTIARDSDEEHALDAFITRMVRLTTLGITPGIASEQMLERRAEAFVQHNTPALTEVHLHLEIYNSVEDWGLIAATKRSWPGWKTRT